MSKYKTTEAKAKHAEQQKLYRLRHPAKVREIGRRYRKGKSLAYKAKERSRYPEKFIARRRLQKAVRRGSIIKPSYCQGCGKKKLRRLLQGHHHDYSKILDVKWLCASCHGAEHRQMKLLEVA